MFKKCSLLFVSLLLLSIVAACGAPPVATQSSTAVATTAAASDPTAAEAMPTEAVAETAAAAETMMPMETATTASETAMSETATTTGSTSGTPFKIGMVTDVGKLDDKSFNESAWTGVQMGAEAIGGESKVIETTDPNDFAKKHRPVRHRGVRCDRHRRLRPGRADDRSGQGQSGHPVHRRRPVPG